MTPNLFFFSTLSVLSLLIPAAFFGALNDAVTVTAESQVVSDETRHMFLQMSRGIAVLLLLVYVHLSKLLNWLQFSM